jgi:hypothetical protein
MSALPPKADIVQHGGDVRFVPKADIEGAGSPMCRTPEFGRPAGLAGVFKCKYWLAS